MTYIVFCPRHSMGTSKKTSETWAAAHYVGNDLLQVVQLVVVGGEGHHDHWDDRGHRGDRDRSLDLN